MVDWSAPLQFITCERGKFKLNNEVVDFLQQIDKPLVVVSIVGIYRTGKSYLMNRLLGKKAGFALGNTVEAKTKGIWVWYTNHPRDPNKGLLVMDTEGLGDAMKGDETYDMHILCLSILLSGTFIFNVIGKLDNSVIDTMDFLTNISKHIHVKANENCDSNFDSMFPHFVLICRDKTLELKMNGKDVTADEYMERVMLTANKNPLSTTEKTRNETKLKLRRYFPKRKCFFFVRPCNTDEDMKKLENLDEEKLQKDFLTESDKFCSYIYQHSKEKTLHQTQPINGPILMHLAKIYIEAINNKLVPCIGSAVNLVASTANSKLLEECVLKYKTLMSDLKLPVTNDKFEAVHVENHKIVVDYFAKKIFFDDSREYHEKLQTRLQDEYIICVQRNYKKSDEICDIILDDFYQPIREKIQNGSYLRNGGYNEFVQDSKQLQRDYKLVPNKGALGDIKLEKFIIKLQNSQETILQADKMLTESERKLEEERVLKEKAEANCKIQKEEKEQCEKIQEIMIKDHLEQMRALEIAYKEKIEQEKKEFEETLKAREKEQERLMKEQFHKEAERVQAEIDKLKAEQQDNKRGIFRSIWNTAGSLLSLIPHPVARIGGVVMIGAGNFI